MDLHYKKDAGIDHVAKFHGDRQRELGDPMANFKKSPRLNIRSSGTTVTIR